MTGTMLAMLKSIGLIALTLLFCSCEKHIQVPDSKKANLVSELIIDNSRCEPFINKLISPSLDRNAIDGIYHDASKAHCIKNDI
jgi:hypothetical protein